MRKYAIFLSLCLMTAFTLLPFSLNWQESKLAHAAELSKAECVMELSSRRIVYEEHGELRLPMASTTKIVTAATVLSLCENLQEKVVIPPEAEGVEGSSVYLKKGDEYTVEELLYGLMLRSGNDCAAALAYHCSGSIGAFSMKMNELAQRAGALQSNFKNPHGLPCEGHYTTARDLTSIACYAMQNELFRKIVSTQYYSPRSWKNKNKMLYLCDGGIGVKTGYTREAGRCLVSAAERKGTVFVCTVLSCSPMYERSCALLDDAFNAYERITLLKAGESFPVEGKGLGVARENFVYPLLTAEREWVEYGVKPVPFDKNVENGEEIIGQLEIYLAKRLLFSTNLYKI